MKINILIDAETGENFSFSSGIEDEVYNQIKLVYDNEESGKREVFIAKHGENINKWGLLQYFDKLQDPKLGKMKADGLLKLYNRKRKKLDVKGVFGDSRVRAGCLVGVRLELGDVKVNQYMMVSSCRHDYSGTHHTMDLNLKGGDITG